MGDQVEEGPVKCPDRHDCQGRYWSGIYYNARVASIKAQHLNLSRLVTLRWKGLDPRASLKM